jgi:hypothetical protein
MAARAPSVPSPPTQAAEHLAINIIITPPSTNLPESNIPTLNETNPPSPNRTPCPSMSTITSISTSTSTYTGTSIGAARQAARQRSSPTRRDSPNRPLPTLNSLTSSLLRLQAQATQYSDFQILLHALLKLAYFSRKQHMSGLKMIDRIIVCIEDGEHRG